MKLSNWNIFFVVLIVVVIILLCIILGIVLYKTFANEPTPKVRTSESKVRILPDRDNKVVLIDGAFHRVDPGLYTKPYHYQGVVHRGPDLVDLNS
jgi:hypothetical protein